MNEEELSSQLEVLRQENARLAVLQVQQNPTASVNRVAIKLSPFWAERPSLWFSQVDSQFAISGITSEETKFNYVVAQLDTRYAAKTAPSQTVHAVATTNDKKELNVFAATEALTKLESELCAKHQQHIRSRSRSRSNAKRSNGKGWC
ncbi:hypothetical protein QTP88_015490 [Uroleucon formosanum]